MKLIIENITEMKEQLEYKRNELLLQLQELQADFEDLSDDQLLSCRQDMLSRVNYCLIELEECDEDNQ